MALTKKQMSFLQDTSDILIDYDGYRSTSHLMGLIDETRMRINYLIRAAKENVDDPEAYFNESGKINPVTIIINAEEYTFTKDKIFYEDICQILLGKVVEAFTVTYSYGRNGRKGILGKGDYIFVKEGMVINAGWTGNA